MQYTRAKELCFVRIRCLILQNLSSKIRHKNKQFYVLFIIVNSHFYNRSFFSWRKKYINKKKTNSQDLLHPHLLSRTNQMHFVWSLNIYFENPTINEIIFPIWTWFLCLLIVLKKKTDSHYLVYVFIISSMDHVIIYTTKVLLVVFIH